LKKENLGSLEFKYPKIKDETIWRWDGECEKHIVFYSARADPHYPWILLTPVAAEIFRMCDGCHTVDRMIDVLKARYEDVGEEELRKDVLNCLRELQRCGVLTDAKEA
jgi:hypothetical protein